MKAMKATKATEATSGTRPAGEHCSEQVAEIGADNARPAGEHCSEQFSDNAQPAGEHCSEQVEDGARPDGEHCSEQFSDNAQPAGEHCSEQGAEQEAGGSPGTARPTGEAGEHCSEQFSDNARPDGEHCSEQVEEWAACDDPVSMQETVSRQYKIVQSATTVMIREAVRFGAILMEVEGMIGNARGRSGEGLKTWLEKHCPEVNYNTARSYKCIAGKAATLVGGTWYQAVAALRFVDADRQTPGIVPSHVAARCLALFADVVSRRELDKAYHAFMLRSLVENGTPEPLPNLQPADEAKAVWARVMGVIEKTSVMDSIPLLPEEAARVCLGRLEILARAVKTHLREIGG